MDKLGFLQELSQRGYSREEAENALSTWRLGGRSFTDDPPAKPEDFINKVQPLVSNAPADVSRVSAPVQNPNIPEQGPGSAIARIPQTYWQQAKQSVEDVSTAPSLPQKAWRLAGGAAGNLYNLGMVPAMAVTQDVGSALGATVGRLGPGTVGIPGPNLNDLTNKALTAVNPTNVPVGGVPLGKIFENMDPEAKKDLMAGVNLLPVGGKMVQGLGGMAETTIKGLNRVVGSVAENITNIPEATLRTAATKEGRQALQAASKTQNELGQNLVKMLNDPIDYLPEAKVINTSLKNMPAISLQNTLKTIEDAKIENPITNAAKLTNKRLDDMAESIKKIGTVPEGATAPEVKAIKFRNLRQQIDKSIHFSAEEKADYDAALLKVRSGMRQDLIDAAQKSGNPQYVEAMSMLSDKMDKISRAKELFGKGENRQLLNAENVMRNLFNKGKTERQTIIGSLNDIFGTDVVQQAKNAQMAEQLGPQGKAQILPPKLSTPMAALAGGVEAYSVMQHHPVGLAAIPAYAAVGSPAVATRVTLPLMQGMEDVAHTIGNIGNINVGTAPWEAGGALRPQSFGPQQPPVNWNPQEPKGPGPGPTLGNLTEKDGRNIAKEIGGAIYTGIGEPGEAIETASGYRFKSSLYPEAGEFIARNADEAKELLKETNAYGARPSPQKVQAPFEPSVPYGEPPAVMPHETGKGIARAPENFGTSFAEREAPEPPKKGFLGLFKNRPGAVGTGPTGETPVYGGQEAKITTPTGLQPFLHIDDNGEYHLIASKNYKELESKLKNQEGSIYPANSEEFKQVIDDPFNRIFTASGVKFVPSTKLQSYTEHPALWDTRGNRITEGSEVAPGTVKATVLDQTLLPDNITVRGTLNLSDNYETGVREPFHTPPGFTVNNDMILHGRGETVFSPGLTVKGNLYGSGAKIYEIPKNTKIEKGLYLENTEITSIPKDIKIGTDLNISGTKVREFPPGLKIPGELRLQDTKIKTLPADLEAGSLDIRGTKITDVPSGVKKVLVDEDFLKKIDDPILLIGPTQYSYGYGISEYAGHKAFMDDFEKAMKGPAGLFKNRPGAVGTPWVNTLSPAQVAQQKTPEFKNFFGDWENKPAEASKVVDAKGQPMPVFHGRIVGEGVKPEGIKGEMQKAVRGGSIGYSYFTDSPEVASNYALNGMPSQQSMESVAYWASVPNKTRNTIMPAYLDIKKPITEKTTLPEIFGGNVNNFLTVLSNTSGYEKLAYNVEKMANKLANEAGVTPNWKKMNLNEKLKVLSDDLGVSIANPAESKETILQFVKNLKARNSQIPLSFEDIEKALAGSGGPTQTGISLPPNLKGIMALVERSPALKEYIESKYDGLIFHDMEAKGGRTAGDTNYGMGATSKTYVPFKSTQIKSSIGNKGQFNPKNPDIRGLSGTEMLTGMSGVAATALAAPKVVKTISNMINNKNQNLGSSKPDNRPALNSFWSK
jgi:hypothetical protein